MANRENDNLQSLGKKTEYRQDYAPEVLESFENKHPENDYWVLFNCPEFTSLCPITGQPDFAEIKIQYVPDVRMVESKSLKLYLFSFRNHGDFHEDCVNIIMKDLFHRNIWSYQIFCLFLQQNIVFNDSNGRYLRNFQVS